MQYRPPRAFNLPVAGHIIHYEMSVLQCLCLDHKDSSLFQKSKFKLHEELDSNQQLTVLETDILPLNYPSVCTRPWIRTKTTMSVASHTDHYTKQAWVSNQDRTDMGGSTSHCSAIEL